MEPVLQTLIVAAPLKLAAQQSKLVFASLRRRLRRRFQRLLQKPCAHAWQPCTRALQLLGSITWITTLETSIAPLETGITALAAAITALRNMLAHVFKLLALAFKPLRVHSTCIKEDQLEATITTTLLAMTTRAVGNVLGSQLSQESVA